MSAKGPSPIQVWAPLIAAALFLGWIAYKNFIPAMTTTAEVMGVRSW